MCKSSSRCSRPLLLDTLAPAYADDRPDTEQARIPIRNPIAIAPCLHVGALLPDELLAVETIITPMARTGIAVHCS